MLAQGHGLTQTLVADHQSLLLPADVVSVKVSSLLELTGLDADPIDAVLGEEPG